ncbi:MAG: MFS transporter [bacterium]|nr:MFS transporter [bacterium]
MKEEFGASDFMMGLLAGPTFALFYATAGIPIARLADSYSRRNIIAISAAVWSVMTVLSGMARSFGMLALFRVGVGEAGCSHPRIRSFRAISLSRSGAEHWVYTQWPPWRAARSVGWRAGGWLAHYFGWRWAFVAAGVPGILFALLVWRLSKSR